MQLSVFALRDLIHGVSRTRHFKHGLHVLRGSHAAFPRRVLGRRQLPMQALRAAEMGRYLAVSFVHSLAAAAAQVHVLSMSSALYALFLFCRAICKSRP